MTSLNKSTCPTCGQSTNEREISLFSDMVASLIAVWKWCLENNRHEFVRKDIKHLFKGKDNSIARWGDWVYFGGLVYKPEHRKGSWGLNIERCTSFINGSLMIPTKVYKDPLGKTLRYEDVRRIDQIKDIRELLDTNGDFIARYRGDVCFHLHQDYKFVNNEAIKYCIDCEAEL